MLGNALGNALGSLLDPLAPGLARGALVAMGGPPVRIVLWDGREVGDAPRPLATVRVKDRAAFALLMTDPELRFGDLYGAGRIELEGDLPEFLTAAFRAQAGSHVLRRLIPDRLLQGLDLTDPEHARENARHHYDVGNDFYALWLDERMVYTCAYFPEPGVSLEEAQLAKLDHVCRKLALRSGQRVLEVGSGWGALALHMARFYGVSVRAFNVSHEQVLYAREQAEKQGLADRVEFIEDDYRAAEGEYDAFVSVGMLEHVGPSHYDDLAEVIERCLVPEGLALLHTIGRAREQSLNRWIAQRVFPNAHPPALSEMLEIIEPHDFVTLDVENLRHHYELTARHWLARFEANRARAETLVGPAIARTWHLYLAGTVASFAAPTLELYQLLFSRRANAHIPWTRAHVYSGREASFAPIPEVGRGSR